MIPMRTRNLLIALTSAAAIVGTVACGMPSAPVVITSYAPNATTSPIPPTPATPGPATPVAGAPSACTELGGVIEESGICYVHEINAGYTVSITFPVDYPDQQALTAALSKQRDQFIDLVGQRPNRGRPYELTFTGTGYRSAASDTQSLVFREYTDNGANHPETYYEAFNYDVGKGAPITLDTLFKPGTNPVQVLDPIVAPELAKRVNGQVNDNIVGAQAYQNFAITDDSVVFFIGQGVWLFEAAGPQEVSVPRAQLDSVLAVSGSGGAAPCSSGQVSVAAGKSVSALTHRATLLVFTLAAGANPCTLTGYPGVDSGVGGPLLHAKRTVSGYRGGLPNDAPGAVTLSASQPAHAVVEGDAVDAGGNQCPTYTNLLVTPPNTTSTGTVAVTIDACALQVHPVGSDLAS